jgi:hypothetical protein
VPGDISNFVGQVGMLDPEGNKVSKIVKPGDAIHVQVGDDLPHGCRGGMREGVGAE